MRTQWIILTKAQSNKYVDQILGVIENFLVIGIFRKSLCTFKIILLFISLLTRDTRSRECQSALVFLFSSFFWLHILLSCSKKLLHVHITFPLLLLLLFFNSHVFVFMMLRAFEI